MVSQDEFSALDDEVVQALNQLLKADQFRKDTVKPLVKTYQQKTNALKVRAQRALLVEKQQQMDEEVASFSVLPAFMFACLLFYVLVCCFMLPGHKTTNKQTWSYQDGCRLVTVHSHGDFIELPHWEARPPAP